MTRSPSVENGGTAAKLGKAPQGFLSNISFSHKLDIREIGGVEREAEGYRLSQAKGH